MIYFGVNSMEIYSPAKVQYKREGECLARSGALNFAAN